MRGVGLIEKREDVANVVVKTGAGGVPVYVKDLGEVVEGKSIRQGAVTADAAGEVVTGMAIMSCSITSPSRTPASKPRATISNSSSVMVMSRVTSG